MPSSDAISDAAIRQALRESQAVATLTIRFDMTSGEIQVGGPFGNPLLFYGLLKMAEKQMDLALRRRSESQIITPSPANGGS